MEPSAPIDARCIRPTEAVRIFARRVAPSRNHRAVNGVKVPEHCQSGGKWRANRPFVLTACLPISGRAKRVNIMANSAQPSPHESAGDPSVPADTRPRSAVSAGVGIVGLAGLVSYLLIARFAPEIAA